MGQVAQRVVDRTNATSIYVALLAVTAFATGIALVAAGDRIDAPVAVVALAIAGAVAERGGMRINGRVELSVSGIPTLFAAVLFGPLAAGFVGASSMLGDPELMSRDRSRAPRLKWASYTSIRFIVGALTGLAATLVATVLRELLDMGFTILTAAVRGASAAETARSIIPLLVIAPPIYAPLVALLAFMYVDVSPWTLALFLPPAIAAQRLYALYRQERQLAADLSVVNEILERANLQFASALIATLDARDRYTAGHSAAVAIYTRDIAQRMSLPPETCDLAYLCGLVHDIGKIGLPPGLLEKPGALTLEERRQMQEHSAIGERILAHVDEYSEIARIVRHHHERIDGQGYPDGLVDEDIPLVSRIIAVADAYNAMTSDRPYRDAMPSRVARLRLAQAVDSQFDTAAVAAFEAILASASEDYRVARRRDFLVVPTSYEEDAPSAEVGPIAEVA
jgi:putative nucleotidyltransferase with HDIG domain